MQKTAVDIIGLDRQISDVRYQASIGTPTDELDYKALGTSYRRVNIEEHNNILSDLGSRRKKTLGNYPMLGRLTPDEVVSFASSGEQEKIAQLSAYFPGILRDIDSAKSDIIADRINLWRVAPVVEKTAETLGITAPKLVKWTDEKVAHEENIELVTNIMLIAMSLIGGVGAFLTSGRLSIGLAATSTVASTADAIKQTRELLVDAPASNTDLDPSQSLIQKELGTSDLAWLAMSWFQVIGDLRALPHIIDEAKSWEHAQRSRSALDRIVRKISGGDNSKEEMLRRVAMELNGSDVIIAGVTRGELQRRLRVAIRFDETLLESAVHMHLGTNSRTGEFFVRELVVGQIDPTDPQRTLRAIERHEEAIRSIERYHGLKGEIRRVHDSIYRLINGRVPEGVNPFDPDLAPSKWAAFEELKKHERAIAEIEVQLDAAKGALKPESDAIAALEKELEEFKQYQAEFKLKVLDEATDSDVVGIIAEYGSSNAAAYRAGYPRFETALENVLNPEELGQFSKDYYYRRRANTDLFEIVRTPNSKAPWLRPETDELGNLTGRFVRDEYNFNRAQLDSPTIFEYTKSKTKELQRTTYAERGSALDARDAVKTDKAAYDKAIAPVTKASQRIGEEAAVDYVIAQYPDAVPEWGVKRVGDRFVATSDAGAGQLDQVWSVVDPSTGEKRFIVIEAKGGTGELTSRLSEGERWEQGTRGYLDSILASMKAKDPELVRELQAALNSGTLDYFLVRAKILADNAPGPVFVNRFKN
jgi:hypothetical protein